MSICVENSFRCQLLWWAIVIYKQLSSLHSRSSQSTDRTLGARWTNHCRGTWDSQRAIGTQSKLANTHGATALKEWHGAQCFKYVLLIVILLNNNWINISQYYHLTFTINSKVNPDTQGSHSFLSNLTPRFLLSQTEASKLGQEAPLAHCLILLVNTMILSEFIHFSIDCLWLFWATTSCMSRYDGGPYFVVYNVHFRPKLVRKK